MKNKNLKKWLSAALACTMAAGLLAGCGGGSDEATTNEDGEVVIEFGIHVANPQEQESVTYNIVQAFNEKYDGQYQVDFRAADTETHSKNMQLAAADGTLPEIFWIEASEAPEYSESGLLLDVSDFLSENPEIQEALGGMENAFTDDNGVYGLPYQSNVQGFFYNKAVFDEAGVAYPTADTTWDEFLEMVNSLKAAGVTPIAIGSKNSNYAMWEFNTFLERYGWTENIDSILDGSEKFNNEDLVKCYEKLKALADAGAFPENIATIEYFDAKQLFDSGEAAMFGSGQWDCAEFDENIGENIGFWWGPKFTDSEYNQDTGMRVPSAPLGISAAVGEDDQVKEAVYAFLQFYYGEEAATMSYEGSIFPAANYDGLTASDTQYAMNAMLNEINLGYESPASAPDLTVSSAVQTALYDSMFGVMQGTYEPAAALDQIDAALANSN